MKPLLWILLILLISTIASAQNNENIKYHSPEEIFELFKKSKVKFSLFHLDGKAQIPCEDKSGNVTASGLFRAPEMYGVYYRKYQMTEDSRKDLKDGERKFKNGNMFAAREYYEKVYNAYPDYSTIITFIGQTYEKESKYQEAIKYYRMAIDKNYYDYLPHWFLADNLAETGNIDEALQEITLASILNRNNQMIDSSMKAIYRKAGRNYRDWCFAPQTATETKGTKVTIAYTTDWIMYAITKALWQHDSEYRKNMGVPSEGYSPQQEEESVLLLYESCLRNKVDKWRNDPALLTLVKATEAGKFDQYLAYEVVIPQAPIIIFAYEKDFIESIKDYVLTLHHSK